MEIRVLRKVIFQFINQDGSNQNFFSKAMNIFSLLISALMMHCLFFYSLFLD